MDIWRRICILISPVLTLKLYWPCWVVLIWFTYGRWTCPNKIIFLFYREYLIQPKRNNITGEILNAAIDNEPTLKMAFSPFMFVILSSQDSILCQPSLYWKLYMRIILRYTNVSTFVKIFKVLFWTLLCLPYKLWNILLCVY